MRVNLYELCFRIFEDWMRLPNFLLVLLGRGFGLELPEDINKHFSENLRNTIIQKITHKHFVLNIKEKEGIRNLIRFLNPDKEQKWEIKSVNLAFKFFLSCMGKKEYKTEYIFEVPTPNRVQVFHPIFLVYFCNLRGISYSKHSNAEDLKRLLDYSLLDFRELFFSLFLLNKSEILSIVSKHNTLKRKYVFDRDSFRKYVKNNPDLPKRKIPLNHDDAIFLAATQNNIDISKAESPLEEYQYLGKMYVPRDKNLKQLWEINSLFISLSVVFNPELPEECYSGVDLINLCQNEGSENIDSPYNELLNLFLKPNFYEFIEKESINKITTLEENLDQVPNNEIIYYGIRGKEYLAFTWKELYKCFNANKYFLIPRTDTESLEIFPSHAIRKLVIECSKKCMISKLKKKKNKLLIKINEILKSQENFETCLNIDYCNSHIKDIEEVFWKILHFAFYLRSWKGCDDPYPLRYRERDENCEFNSQIAAFELNDILDKKPHAKFIMELPLLRYIDKKFVTCGQYGKSIRDKMQIIEDFHKSQRVDSCVRSASNYFIFTIIFFSAQLKIFLPFSIDDIDEFA